MKKLISSCFIFISLASTGLSQELKSTAVPAAVKINFDKENPGVPATWKMENGLYEASYKVAGRTFSFLYDPSGLLNRRESQIGTSDLPASVRAYVAEHYKGQMIREARRIIHADGTIDYEVEVAAGDFLFDANGNFQRRGKSSANGKEEKE